MHIFAAASLPFLALIAPLPAAAASTPAGTAIVNVPRLSYDGPTGGTVVSVAANALSITVVGHRTPSSVAFLTYAAGSPPLLTGPSRCSSDGGTTFVTLPPPVSADGKQLDPAAPQPLGPALLYYPGDPVFVRVADPDQNLDSAKRETVVVRVSVAGTGERRALRLMETGADTGLFAGYLPTARSDAGGCTLTLAPDQRLRLEYTDKVDSSDTSKADALVAPLNVVFDSTTGKRIDGAKITLVEADRGSPAIVTARDGVSGYPSTVTSGDDVTDDAGVVYPASKGAFLLPQVASGRYRLQVKPPKGYRYASSADPEALQKLPGAPYALGAASFGRPFSLKRARPVGYDIPLDPVSTSLYVQKTASAVTAAVGDMLQFNVTVENTDARLAARDVYVLDTLPQGFRYIKGSARIASARADEPAISADGQQLRFDIGTLTASGQMKLTYVVEVTAATPLGTAINRAQGFGAGGAASNTATAQVQIRNELMQNVNTLIGRVLLGCGADSKTRRGVAGVRILMENGAYAVTDKSGRFHFEAVKNGTHVVQLDEASLPEGYTVMNCGQNTRFAGRSFSQFVEVHGGALWRTDFHVRKTAEHRAMPAGKAGPAPAAESDKPSRDTFKLDAHWLQTASAKPAILWPAKGWLPAIQSIQVAVKHGPAERVRLSINGEAVSPRNFLGVTRNKTKTVAVSQWLGVPLAEGDNALVAEIVRNHKVVERLERNVHYSGVPVRAEIAPGASHLVADGKTKPRIAIRLYDRWGYPARRGTLGRYTVEAPYMPYQSEQELQKRQLLAVGPREPVYTVGDDGIATIVLSPTTRSGQVTVEIPFAGGTRERLTAWLQPGERDWVLVGLASGTAAFNAISGHIETLSGDDPNRDIYQDGRVAFYAKGMIKGQYLITAAYDTARATGVPVTGLEQSVNPNQYFMLYGDASERGYDASSASKLYLKIERGRFYAMFGDFSTGLTVTELSRYQRRFNGVKSEYEGERFKYKAFAARNAQSYVRDQIQGDGTSGLYHLSHRRIVLNSERIRIETRDRYHSERVIESRPLSRYLDYTIDYYNGTIFFKQPVPHRDEHFNPVYIVAEYEVMRSGDQAITAGGRAAAKFAGDKVELGATFVNEGAEGGSNKLMGADLRVDFSPTTQLKAEVSRTLSGAGVASTLAGGALPPGAAVTTAQSDVAGNAYLVTLANKGEKLEGELYLRREGTNFGLGQQSLGQTGMRKLGGDARYHLGKHLSLNGELYRQESLRTPGLRKVADAGMTYQTDGDSVTAGVRRVHDNYLVPSADESRSTATGTGAVDQVYLGGAVSVFDKRLTLHGTTDRTVGGGSDPAWPDSTTLGIDYKLTDSATLFMNQQFAGGGRGSYSRMTELGIRTTPWERAKVTSSLTQQMTEYGPRTFSTMGLTQGWQASDRLTLTAGLNRVSSLRRAAVPVVNPATPPATGAASEDFTSAFVGATYRESDWSWTGRIESLNASSENRLGLFGGFYRDLSHGNGFSASLHAFDSRFTQGGTSTRVDGRLGFAHRPDDSRWALLEQLDLIYLNQQGLGTSPFIRQGDTGIVTSRQSPAPGLDATGSFGSLGIDQRTWKLVNNLQANYRADDFQWSVYYGSKFARFAFVSGAYQGYTDLIGSEYRYNLSPRWDVGAVASQLHSWRSGVFKRAFGIETGWSVATNIWLSVGYNFQGFYDEDFTAAHYTAKGLFIRFRLKFDQDTLKEMAGYH